MKRLALVDYILIVEAIIFVALIALIVVQQSNQQCTLTFEVHKGVNYDQPYPTYRHCGLGDVPEVR